MFWGLDAFSEHESKWVIAVGQGQNESPQMASTECRGPRRVAALHLGKVDIRCVYRSL